jgi:hypothetical protein
MDCVETTNDQRTQFLKALMTIGPTFLLEKRGTFNTFNVAKYF